MAINHHVIGHARLVASATKSRPGTVQIREILRRPVYMMAPLPMPLARSAADDGYQRQGWPFLNDFSIRTASYKCHSSDGSAPIKDPIGAIVAELVAAGLDVAEAQWLRDQTDGSGPRCTPPPPTPDRR